MGGPALRTRRRGISPPYLLDTHVWFWYLTGSPRLMSMESLAKARLEAIDGEGEEVKGELVERADGSRMTLWTYATLTGAAFFSARLRFVCG